MQGEIFKMKSDRFFTRPACVYVHSLLPRVLPVGWESCQRGKLEVVISRGSEFEGEEGKNRGRSQNRSNRQEDRALTFLDRWPGKKPRPPVGGALGPWKEQTWKKKTGWLGMEKGPGRQSSLHPALTPGHVTLPGLTKNHHLVFSPPIQTLLVSCFFIPLYIPADLQVHTTPCCRVPDLSGKHYFFLKVRKSK